MMKVGIIGAGSFVAKGLLKILSVHKEVEIKVLHSTTHQGKNISSVWPFFKGQINLSFGTPPLKKIKSECDCIFIAKPHGESSGVVKEIFSKDLKIIDLSADFRLPNLDYYKKWYPKIDHQVPELLSKAIYGLPELYREEIKNNNFIANPGCYPTAVILSLLPLVKEKIIKTQKMVVNALSGVSGAGLGYKEGFNHFLDIYRNLKIYRPGKHQHTPEMELALEKLGGEKTSITFIPCLVPIDSGILAISTHHLDKKFTKKDIFEIYTNFYTKEPFIRVAQEGYPEVSSIIGTNFCDIGFEIDTRNGLLMVAAVIDNAIKGAAGQAVQNMNIMFGFDEREGLLPVK